MNKVFFGDCRTSMRELLAQGVKVQTCVTSPPYFGLRDYGHPGQIGLESTPVEYVDAMIEVFECVRDLLADDGTLWLNLGDSYAANRSYQVPSTLMNGDATNKAQAGAGQGMRASDFGLKPKDLIGIPWRVALALRDQGWYLRQDIIWSKPNPMPESVTDRCTKAHEYIFLLSKSERYYYDAGAIKEDAKYTNIVGMDGSGFKPPQDFAGKHSGGSETLPSRTRVEGADDGMRNKRSVWTVATKPYAGAHFATFPPELIEPCILAGAPSGGIVLDPFFGSGTTGQVCQALGRQWIGCELNPAYEDLQIERTRQSGMEFA